MPEGSCNDHDNAGHPPLGWNLSGERIKHARDLQLNVVPFFRLFIVFETLGNLPGGIHTRRTRSLLNVGGTWAGLINGETSRKKKKRKAIDSWMGRGIEGSGTT
jgi:hypothetical protein